MSEARLSTYQILKNKFTANAEAVILTEVPCHPIGGGRIDYMIVNMWASRGYSIHGIERKSNRSDWLRELKKPAKQEDHFKYCDRFWLLTDRENVAKLEEIPETWGWYHINKSGILKTMKEAPKLEAHPIDRFMMCSMVRRAGDRRGFVHESELEQRIEQKAEIKCNQQNNEFRYKAEDYDRLKERVDLFEAAAGVKLNSWGHDPQDVGNALKLFLENKVDDHVEYLERFTERLKVIGGEISKAINEFKKEKSISNT